MLVYDPSQLGTSQTQIIYRGVLQDYQNTVKSYRKIHELITELDPRFDQLAITSHLETITFLHGKLKGIELVLDPIIRTLEVENPSLEQVWADELN